MSRFSRRRVLGSLTAAGLASAGIGLALNGAGGGMEGATAVSSGLIPDRTPFPRRLFGETATIIENMKAGSTAWIVGVDGTRPADDILNQIKAYTSAPGTDVGGRLDFHVSVADAEPFTIGIYRIGWYGGAGARHLFTTEQLPGVRQAPLEIDPLTGTISCAWSPSWTLNVGKDWMPGVYIGVFTTKSGWRNYAPFVVHDPNRVGGLCIVLPFSTYQAYNQWPVDGMRGRSLYLGYAGSGVFGDTRPDGTPLKKTDYLRRAYKVSFDRPFSRLGLPMRFDEDQYLIQWAEGSGYDLNYATSLDLETGKLKPANHFGLVFSGHDEYWSRTMRDSVDNGIRRGVSVAFMEANNVYWRVRFESSPDGRPNRVMTCYKTGIDAAEYPTSATMRWRDPNPGSNEAEQEMLGVQYNGIIRTNVPLIVKDSKHWFWDGVGVRDGDAIPKVIDGEADGFDPAYPSPQGVDHALLSASPYHLKANGAPMMQNTSLYEAPSGSVVFVAGTLNWTKALSAPKIRDPRIGTATGNLFDRMARHR